MSDEPRIGALEVPGAHLHYEVRGAGPLVVLNGVPMGAAGFAELATLLAEHYTVLSYDPRGTFRSRVDDPAQEITPELLGDDLHRLLSALDAGPARLFGNSGGAVTGLALVVRHPGQVLTFVAHEPPLPELLPERTELRAALDQVCDTYRTVGREAALKGYAAVTGIERFAQPPSARRVGAAPASFTPPADVRAILDCFFRHLLRPIAGYRPDVAALRNAPTRIVVAGGSTSRGQLAHRAAVALADRLGTPVVDLPGGHTGFQQEPRAFAGLLHRLFTEVE